MSTVNDPATGPASTNGAAGELSDWRGRTLPLGKCRRAANVPGGHHVYPIEFALGEPGVKQGQ